jgi:plastocyanin
VKVPHLAAALVVITAVAGCGGSTSQGTVKPSGTSQPKSGAITIANFKFAPGTLTVKRGTRVIVTNHDSAAHTATADDGKSFDTGDISDGASATFTVDRAGTYSYHCAIHPFMKATLVVK